MQTVQQYDNVITIINVEYPVFVMTIIYAQFVYPISYILDIMVRYAIDRFKQQ